MSRYTRHSPYMDPTVFRSATYSYDNARPDILSPRHATTDLSRSLRLDDYFSDPLDRDYSDSRSMHSYRSDRRYPDQYGTSERDMDNLVDRTNDNAALTNSSIERVTHGTLIQPKICSDGRYPPDFPTPMSLAEFMTLRESQLDRLLEDYEISVRGRTGYSARDRGFGSGSERDIKLVKLAALLAFLGARQIADVIRSGSGGGFSGARSLFGESRR